MSAGGPVAAAVAEGRLPGRVWFYSTYACNLACTYCLSESAPGVPRRALAGETMVDLAAQGRRARLHRTGHHRGRTRS